MIARFQSKTTMVHPNAVSDQNQHWNNKTVLKTLYIYTLQIEAWCDMLTRFFLLWFSRALLVRMPARLQTAPMNSSMSSAGIPCGTSLSR